MIACTALEKVQVIHKRSQWLKWVQGWMVKTASGSRVLQQHAAQIDAVAGTLSPQQERQCNLQPGDCIVATLQSSKAPTCQTEGPVAAKCMNAFDSRGCSLCRASFAKLIGSVTEKDGRKKVNKF